MGDVEGLRFFSRRGGMVSQSAVKVALSPAGFAPFALLWKSASRKKII